MDWKPKMKLKCHECNDVSKMIVSKTHNKNDDIVFKIKCKKCNEEYFVTEDLLKEMGEYDETKNNK